MRTQLTHQGHVAMETHMRQGGGGHANRLTMTCSRLPRVYESAQPIRTQRPAVPGLRRGHGAPGARGMEDRTASRAVNEFCSPHQAVYSVQL